MNKAKATEAERQATAVAAAVEKAKQELQTSAPGPSEELVKRHTEELRALEEKLTTKHQQDLKAAVEEAQKQNPPSTTAVDQKAAIEAAIAEHDKLAQARHTEEIASAVDRGRMEQVAKGKLKDSQLVRAQKRVKELELQILEWRKAGLVPEAQPPAAAPTATVTPVAGSSTTATAGPSTATVPTQVAVAATAATPVPAATLPRKPSMGTPTGPAVGVGRGGAVGRGGPPRAVPQRGGAPGRAPPARPAPTTPAPGNISIMGAAGKRPREDPATPEDSLAKRLKPAEASGTGKPVTLRRPPPA